MISQRWKEPALSVAGFGAVLLLWGLLCAAGPWNSELLPSPTRTAASMWELLVTGTLLRHVAASVLRVALGYSLAVACALPLGMLLGWWKAAQLATNALIQFFRPISPLAWIPLAMLWFGIGDKPAIFLIFLSSFFPLLVATISAVNLIDPLYLRVASNFDLTAYETVTKVLIPAILPTIFPALRISLGIAWLVVVAAEMIAVKSGLGYLILDARNALRMDFVLDAMIAIGLVGILLDRLIQNLGSLPAFSWTSR